MRFDKIYVYIVWWRGKWAKIKGTVKATFFSFTFFDKFIWFCCWIVKFRESFDGTDVCDGVYAGEEVEVVDEVEAVEEDEAVDEVEAVKEVEAVDELEVVDGVEAVKEFENAGDKVEEEGQTNFEVMHISKLLNEIQCMCSLDLVVNCGTVFTFMQYALIEN